MSAELTIIESGELMQVAEKSNINITKAKAYAMGYAPYMEQVNELSLVLKDLDKESPTSEDALKARRARLDLVKVRKAAEDKKSKDKEIIVIEGRLIDGLFNVVKNAAQLTESEYLEIEKHQERAEEARKEALKSKRSLLLEPYETDLTYIAIGEMSDDQFNAFFQSQKTAFEAKKEAERLAEISRIEAEKKAEADRIAKEKAEIDERERIKKENAKLKAAQEKLKKEQDTERKRLAEIQVKKDAEDKKERERLAKIQAEKDRIAAEEKAKLEAENKKIAQELAAKKAKELQEARVKKEAEEAEKAKLKAASLAPDKEKINAMYLEIKNFKFPELNDPDAIKLIEEVKQGFSIILKGIVSAAKTLK